MDITTLCSKYFLSLMILLGLISALGECVVLLFRETGDRRPFYTRLFSRLLAGMLAVVFIYAAWFTHFQTIQATLFLLFLLLLFYRHRQLRKFSHTPVTDLRKREWGKILLFLTGAAAFFLSWELAGFIRDAPFPFSLHKMRDFAYYAHVSNYIRETGLENLYASASLISNDYAGTTPYHYFELWITSLGRLFSGNGPLDSLMLLTYPLLYVVFYTGVLALIEIYRPVTCSELLIAVPLLFCSGVFFVYYNGHPFLKQAEAYSVFPFYYFKKLAVYYILLIASVLALHYKKQVLFFAAWLCLPVVSSDALFGVAGSCAALLLFNPVLKIFSRDEWRQSLALFMTAFLFIGAFYFFTGNKIILAGEMQGVLDPDILFQKENLLRSFRILVASFLLFALLFWPYAAVLWFISKTAWTGKNKYLFHFLLAGLLMMLASLVAWGVLFKMLNSYQFFKNTALAFVNTLLIFLFVKVLFDPACVEKRKTLAGLLLTGYLLLFPLNDLYHFIRTKISYVTNAPANEFGDAYLKQVTDYMNEHRECNLGAAVIAPSYYSRFEIPHPISMSLGEYLTLCRNPVMTTDIGLFSIDSNLEDSLAASRLKAVLKQSPFSRFVEKQTAENRFVSIAQSQVDFVRENRMRFLIISEGLLLPAALEPHVKIRFRDERSGEQFLVLKNE